MMRTKLKGANLPQDLVYLAMIESGYDPNAYSSAASRAAVDDALCQRFQDRSTIRIDSVPTFCN